MLTSCCRYSNHDDALFLEPTTGYNINFDGATIGINATDELEVLNDGITSGNEKFKLL